MEKVLYILCGAAGSGKSTWAAKHADPTCSTIVSRDRIRLSMLSPEEEYFSKEDAVITEFYNQITQALAVETIAYVYADATHLTEKARKALIDNITFDNSVVKVIPVVIRPSPSTHFKQNAQREGRALVPNAVIKRMYNSYTDPIKDKYEYNNIVYITEGD